MFSSFRGDPELIKLVRTMKLIIVFLMVSVSALFANVAAQDMKLDLRVEHKSLIEVMDLLKQKSGFSFIYSPRRWNPSRGSRWMSGIRPFVKFLILH